jgi:hypothetical protein
LSQSSKFHVTNFNILSVLPTPKTLLQPHIQAEIKLIDESFESKLLKFDRKAGSNTVAGRFECYFGIQNAVLRGFGDENGF